MPKQTIDQKVNVLNIRLPDDIMEWLDTLVDQGIYSSRSEIVRDMMREFIINEEQK